MPSYFPQPCGTNIQVPKVSEVFVKGSSSGVGAHKESAELEKPRQKEIYTLENLFPVASFC